MHSRKSQFGLPIPVQRALRKFGQDVRDARKRRRLTRVILFLILLCSCGNDTTGIYPPVLPHDPVNAAWKAVENFQFAYNTQNIDLLEVVLDSDFKHHLEEEYWDDYNGDGIIDTYWDLDIELLFIDAFFDLAGEIELTLTGEDEQTWPDDSLNWGLELPRIFDLKVHYYVGSQYEEFRISGAVSFICRADSTDEWCVWQLFAQPSIWWPPE
ncbi:MAG: hypothetical protein ABFR50_04900 [Candidatus Fermentibacteria bacterium]